MKHTAVVLIHGIGEQMPMSTIRPFVKSILGCSDEPVYWSKPDRLSETFELRKLQSRGEGKTHFYEYYWAYNISGTKFWDVTTWILRLAMRKWKNIPTSTKSLWIVARLTLFLTFVTTAICIWFGLALKLPTEGMAWITLMILTLATQYFWISYLGDAARYLSPRPCNIAMRRKVRSEGLKLLRKIHQSGEYDRVILVGHSLGSVIGYDLITHLWQEYHDKSGLNLSEDAKSFIRRRMEEQKSPQEMVRNKISLLGESLSTSDERVEEFQRMQFDAWKEQRFLGNGWLITDFITLGSPLTHAMLLLASSESDFEERKDERELLTCPPQRDKKSYAYSSNKAVEVGEGKKYTFLQLHHAAPFAVTRWSNLYFPTVLGLFGDIVGGKIAPSLGYGIRDIPVTTRRWKGFAKYTIVAHTSYWHRGDRGEASAGDACSSLQVLRKVLDVR